ncbi:MAG TPA: alpha/beta hydrolase [Thermoleophilia bacterium]|nr:alpha/beta hydrolase [Thermoleophilia bacterium]
MDTQLQPSEREIGIELEAVTLKGNLVLVPGAPGLVLFVHGSGSSRFSSRNRQVAADLQAGGLATLLFDLLSPEEERIDDITRELRFDIGLLTRRVIGVSNWLDQNPDTGGLSIGYFGASTGAAAALEAAAFFANRDDLVKAVVSRGGRPDLAMEALSSVVAPTLLIVGGNDTVVIEMNRRAFDRLTAVKDFRIVPNATHLFEEPGALEEVSRLARGWFQRYLLPEG